MLVRRLFLTLAALCLAGVAVAATPRFTPAPPSTLDNQMWLDPGLPGTAEAAELAAKGYIRQEYFQSGEANIYAYGPDGKVRAEQRDVPYTTRVIVIRPADPRRFSGTVFMGPSHPLYGGHFWSNIKDLAFEKGHAYATVMSGADDNTRRMPQEPNPTMATKVLGWFNPARYAAIRWPADEDGIRWDVFADTARLIRTPDALMGPLRVEKVYASGWSYTGSFLRTYINSGFHEQNRLSGGRPLIDGYLLGISASTFRSGWVPLNTRIPMLADDDPRRVNRPIDVPVIELMSENEGVTNKNPPTPVSRALRTYEVPGLTHTGGSRRSEIQQIQMAARTGQPQAGRGGGACPFPQSDVDMADYAQAAYDNLDRWSRAGVAAPPSARLIMDGTTARKDANGNALGGFRPAQLEVPLASYGAAPAGSGCDPPGPGVGSPSLPMRRVPLPPERLRALYPGGRAEYLRRFDAHVDRLLAERRLRAPDAARQKREARAAADAAFR